MPETQESLRDIYKVLDRVLVEGELVLEFQEPRHLTRFRHRCNRARALDRKESREYPIDDPRNNTSAYDPICIDQQGLLKLILSVGKTVLPSEPGIVSITSGGKKVDL